MEVDFIGFGWSIHCECSNCKKTFYRSKEHSYKIKGQTKYKYFCSWKCLRTYEHSHDALKKPNRLF